MTSYEGSPPDEGYSEDPLTVSPSGALPPWMASMTVPERTEYVMSVIAHLPTSEVAEIVRRLRPRLYINFFKKLPPEVCLKILGFLDPVSLINTARGSREWMLLALDRKLWEQLYILEGFRVIKSEVQSFEESLNLDRSRPSGDSSDEHASKRRATSQRMQPSFLTDDSDMMDVDVSGIKQMSIFGGKITKEPVSTRFDLDTPMMSPSHLSSMKSTQYPTRLANSFQGRSSRTSSGSTLSHPSAALSSISSLVVIDRSDNKKKLNWQYLYSQRRRLEANWEAERYTNFQLPHPAYPEEAHEECIYTIQHSGKYLVSGSRDKTLRIWDLDTRRLVRPPLRAHSGSVLCLQFDADPEEDLIVSGSSDATVVLWRFSTGQIIQRLRKAHRESVLNVRFDKRVLVTCSKDKTIKIFNRKPLSAGELGYPGLSAGVNPVPTYLNNYGFNPPPTAGLPVKPPYSMIGCLEGHGAAVNAVQIYNNEVVSASGDRTVKVWDWPEQTCIRTLIGHSKGIACVQYDGRRIVSGSSDNEVKVFDKESGLEVASLRAHANLVRTVQAGFGDLPFSAEEDKEDAKAIDHEYFRAVDSGAISRAAYQQRGRPRNAGSRKPEDITAYGAKLPPGGGGGKFGRIVSGSYDETIIIWRRDKEGVWRAQHTLRQEEAAQAASRMIHEPRRSNDSITSQTSQLSQPSQPLQSQPLPTPQAPQASTSTTQALPHTMQAPHPDLDALTVPFAPGSDAWYRYTIAIAVTQSPAALRQALQRHPQIMQHDYLDHLIATMPATTQQIMNTIVGAARQTHGMAGSGSSSSSGIQPLIPFPTTVPSASSGPVPASQTAATQTVSQGAAVQAPPAAVAPPPAVIQAAMPAPAPQPSHTHHHHHLPTNMARVFKLQFDARRIICCSQTSIIVGWDFANGDEQIIEASRFFAPIE
ncbi:WD40 repeat-like protein [Mollisia scopiformis]|uniref:WD40 repeat-like protein n=1 Tax=Mollisia scopiformis TaxID=149040 RepID=A0A132B3H6_MOLSC|nr:WD40 repeat-like protein [Mollisia scopiformis]KUJ06474.1 WD40 repeat-like protein [Mollisia scopiformis]